MSSATKNLNEVNQPVGYAIEVSACCKARVAWSGGNDPVKICPECQRGSWPHGVKTIYVYQPSDWEKAWASRVEALEKRLSELEKK